MLKAGAKKLNGRARIVGASARAERQSALGVHCEPLNMLALLSGDFFAPNAKSYVIRSSKLPAEPLKQLLLTEKKIALVQYAVSVNEQCTNQIIAQALCYKGRNNIT